MSDYEYEDNPTMMGRMRDNLEGLGSEKCAIRMFVM